MPRFSQQEFISIASHELKTPLTGIKAYHQLMKLHNFKNIHDKKLAIYLGKIGMLIDNLNKLVNELMNVSKLQTGNINLNRKRFDINLLVRDIVDTLKLTTDKHKFKISGMKKAMLSADKDKIKQVLNNLLVNAVKYSPQGGDIEILVLNHNKKVDVSIKDQGIGIHKREQKKIFERFYQTQQKRKLGLKGLGLGLYISSEIVKRHGGKIWVNSKPGKGSTFNFSLPVKIPRK